MSCGLLFFPSGEQYFGLACSEAGLTGRGAGGVVGVAGLCVCGCIFVSKGSEI